MMAFETREYGSEGSLEGRDRSMIAPPPRARASSRHIATPSATVEGDGRGEMTREVTKSA
jgi:hypothetical protein